MLKKAAEIYKTFIGKASGNDGFAAAVKRAKERSTDIEDTVKFIEEGDAARKADEAAQKQAKAHPPPPPPPPAGDAASGPAGKAPPAAAPAGKAPPAAAPAGKAPPGKAPAGKH